MYLGWTNMNLVEGHMVNLVNDKDKSRTSAAIYMHENKLYIIEGTVPAGYPVPDFFQQSVGWLDEKGNDIRYLTIYHNGFQKPEVRTQAWRPEWRQRGSWRTGESVTMRLKGVSVLAGTVPVGSFWRRASPDSSRPHRKASDRVAADAAVMPHRHRLHLHRRGILQASWSSGATLRASTIRRRFRHTASS